MNTQTSNTKSAKIAISSIVLTRAEGRIKFCGIPHMVSSMADAQIVLMGMSREDEPRFNDKVDFTVTYDDGHEYTGTYNLAKFDAGDLAEHMLANLRCAAQIGLNAAALAFVQSIDRDGSRRRAALEFLATREIM
jgi:hypothetical protein